jgi:Xaa-Pro aminopeptidase
MLHRVNKLRQQFNGYGLDGMLIGHAPNRRYLSGFSGSAGWLLLTEHRAVIAVDFRYVEQAKRESPDFEVSYIKSDISEWLPGILSDLKITGLGIEADYMPVSQYQVINQSLKDKNMAVRVVPVKNITESLRIVKDNSELDYIKRACKIADEAVNYVQNNLRAGISEIRLAWELESFMRTGDSGAMPFEIIVASGVNSALPHHSPSEKIIMPGEPVTIDMGASYQGYCSDITRTFIIG